MAKRIIGTPLEKKVVALYLKGGRTAKEVASVFGCSDATVCSALHRQGHRQRAYGGRGGKRLYNLSEEQLQGLIAGYASGKSCEELSSSFGLPWPTVNRLLKERGVSLRPAGFRSGPDHHDWKGGRTTDGNGYVHVLIHEGDPFYEMGRVRVGSLRYVPEHRLVMARHLGRPLTERETVHHIDGNRQNNDISNLQLRIGRHGAGVALCCADCGSHNIVERELQ